MTAMQLEFATLTLEYALIQRRQMDHLVMIATLVPKLILVLLESVMGVTLSHAQMTIALPTPVTQSVGLVALLQQTKLVLAQIQTLALQETTVKLESANLEQAPFATL